MATDDLARIPENVAMVAGGLEPLVPIKPKRWIHTPLYDRHNVPEPPTKFTCLSSPSTFDPSSDEGPLLDDDEVIPMCKKALREICRGRELNTLPVELRAVLVGEVLRAWQPSSAAREEAQQIRRVTHDHIRKR